MTRKEWIDGPVTFTTLDDRWVLLNKYCYGEDYYVHPDSEVYSDVWRAQWVYPGGRIATLDYYVRKEGYGDAEDQWEVVERVHFYDPDKADHQLTAKTYTQKIYPATEENLQRAKYDCLYWLGHRDNGHLSEWWAEREAEL